MRFSKNNIEVELELYGRNRVVGLRAAGRTGALKKIRGLYCDPYKPNARYGIMPATPFSLRILEQMEDEGEISLHIGGDVKVWEATQLIASTELDKVTKQFSLCYRDDLYDFQRKGVSFMRQAGMRVLLGDDPRLGKTVQSLIAMDLEAGDEPIHIFTLKGLIDWWGESVATWTTREPVVLTSKMSVNDRLAVMTERKERVVYVTNWEALRKLKKGHRKFRNIICDEVHQVRNRKSLVGKSFSKLRPLRAILASATLIERGPQDYYNLLRILDPFQFRSYWRFVGWYCNTMFNGFGNTITGPKNTDLLRQHLAPIMLRRRAEDVADVPDKIFETINVVPTSQLKNAYAELEEETIIEFADTDTMLLVPNEIARLVRLRQISISPRTIGYSFDSPKITVAADYVESNPGVKIVIYTSFRDAARELAKEISKRDIDVVTYMGGDDSPRSFTQGVSRVLVTNSATGGVGQDYSMADIIIYADLPLSATMLSQSMWRTTKVNVENAKPRLIVMLSCTKIDEVIADLIQDKQEAIEESDVIFGLHTKIFGREPVSQGH